MSKIIFINRFFFPDHSATSQLLSDLAFYLARQGHQVEVIASWQLYEKAGAKLARKERMYGVLVKRIRTSRFGRGNLVGRAIDYLSFYVGATFALIGTVGRGDIIVAKTDPPLISVIAALVAKIRGAALVNWVQDVFPEVARALGVKVFTPAVNRFLIWLRNKSWHFAKANVVLGLKMADYLLDAGVSKKRIHIIHNWADNKNIKPVKKEDNQLRNAWGLNSKFVVGYSGNMGRAHEFSTILRIASAFQGDPRIVFLFIGGGAQRNTIENEAHEYGLKNVLFRPYQDSVQLSMSLSVPDLHVMSLKPELERFIVPSKFYGIAAVARPVLFIGDDKGEIAMILKENGGGNAICTGDVEGGVRFIGKLNADNAYRAQLGARMMDMSESKYSQSIALESWCELLENLDNNHTA